MAHRCAELLAGDVIHACEARDGEESEAPMKSISWGMPKPWELSGTNYLFIFTKEAPKKPSLPTVKQCFGRTQSISKDSVVV